MSSIELIPLNAIVEFFCNEFHCNENYLSKKIEKIEVGGNRQTKEKIGNLCK